ncbi:MAG: hypothetical protein RL199_271 [Pseudomonadota bacterium]|jgi:hypothetical protein
MTALGVVACAKVEAAHDMHPHEFRLADVEPLAAASQPLKGDPRKNKARPAPEVAPVTGPELDGRLLVLSADGQEANLLALRQTLDYLGTPYTVWVASQRPAALTASVLATGRRGHFQGVIAATAALSATDGAGGWKSALSDAEWAALDAYEAAFRVRHVNAYAYPTAALGLGAAAGVDTMAKPIDATLTAAGRTVFPYLNTSGPLIIRNAWAYLADPVVDPTITPLLTDGAGHALATVRTFPDGREWMTLTFDGNPYLVHTLALSYGLVDWVTRGVFVGERRSYMAPQVDDLFLPSDLYGSLDEYRMTGEDLSRAADWQTRTRKAPVSAAMTLEWAFNGEGAAEDDEEDTLVAAAQELGRRFHWLSHTFTHRNIDATGYDETWAELEQNEDLRAALGLAPFSPRGLIQPEVSGLHNPAAMEAITDFGIEYVVSDTSRPGEDNPTPNAGLFNALQPGVLMIPRRPTNLFYNVSTPAEWVAEYNDLYRLYWGRDLSYDEILDKESDMLVLYMLRWETDPWMFHQANVRAYDGRRSLLSDLLDRALAKYTRVTTVPVVSPSMDEMGDAMRERMAFDASGVTAVVVPGVSVTLTASKAATIPVTGVPSGDETYAGKQVAHIAVKPGRSVTVKLK